MAERKTVIDQIEITRGGAVQLRLGLLLIDGDKEVDCKWHRTVVPAGGSVAAQIAAVNEHLATMGYPEVGADVVKRVLAHIETDRKFRK